MAVAPYPNLENCLRCQHAVTELHVPENVYRFTGDCAPCYVRRTDSRQENVAVAEEIQRYIEEKRIFSPNFPARYCGITPAYRSEKIRIIAKEHNLLIETLLNKPKTELSDFENLLKLVEDYRIGNCLEMSVMGYVYARKQYGDRFYFSLQFLSRHVFFIIGAPRREQPATQGWDTPLLEDDVISDTWSRSHFPVAYWHRYLYNLAHVFPKATFGSRWDLPIVYTNKNQQILSRQLPEKSTEWYEKLPGGGIVAGCIPT
jgi:hypothetical protein